MRVLRNYPGKFENTENALVLASDDCSFSVVAVEAGKEVYRIENAHNCWIRGLAIWEVRDGLNLRNIVITAGESDMMLKMWDGMDGKFLREIQVSHTGVRWRSIEVH